MEDTGTRSRVDIAAGGSGSSALIVSGAPDAEPPTCVGEAVVGSGDVSHDDTPVSEILGRYTYRSRWRRR